ncbi:MAG: MarR family transcriptional regulator [Gammaproteobacteria bacterium]
MDSKKKLIAEILQTGARLRVARDKLLAGFECTSAKARLLKAIRRVPAPFTVSELARVTEVSRQTLLPTIHALESEGLIRLAPSPRNPKARVITLTALGRVALERILRVEDRWFDDIVRGFDERTLTQTAWVLHVVRERLS